MNTPGYSISPATQADADAVAPLFDAYRQFYGYSGEPAKARAFITERLRNSESHILLARELLSPHSVIGFTQLYPLFSSTHMRRAWLLNDLFVMPAWRRHGVARTLLQKAREFAATTNAVEMSLETAHDNAAAQAVYEQLGWEREAVFVKYNLRLA